MLAQALALLLSASMPPPATCAQDFAILQSADAILKSAEGAVQQQKMTAARTANRDALRLLEPLSWSIKGPACDEQKFRAYKMSLMERSFAVSVQDGALSPQQAVAADESITSIVLTDCCTLTEFHAHYPDLVEKYLLAKDQIANALDAQTIRWHNPTTTNCGHPNLDAVQLRRRPMTLAEARILESLPSGRALYAKARVNLNPDGTIANVYLAHSSGNKRWDDYVLADAAAYRYLPRIINCRRVPSIYLFPETFP